MLKLEYLPPCRELVEFVSAYYHFIMDEDHLDDFERSDIAQLRFNFKGNGRIEFPKASGFEIPRYGLYGPRMTFSKVIATGPLHVIGAGILPVAWSALTGLPADKYINTVVDAELFFGPELVTVAEAGRVAGEQGNFRAAVDGIDAFLLSRVKAARCRPASLSARALRASNDPLVVSVRSSGCARRIMAARQEL